MKKRMSSKRDCPGKDKRIAATFFSPLTVEIFDKIKNFGKYGEDVA